MGRDGSKVVSLEEERTRRAMVGKATGTDTEAASAVPGGATAWKQMNALLADPRAREVVRALPEQQFYWILTEVGMTDAVEFWELASPQQRMFILDMELWDSWNFSEAKSHQWLNHLLEAGEEAVLEQLPHMDAELLILMFKKEIIVGGGIGDLVSDEERVADWDHSFDNVYFITFRNAERARAVGTFIDIIFRNDRELYLGLMEGIKVELESELEELAYRFRSGRLADLGFPELEDALTIYARLSPDSFIPSAEKRLDLASGITGLPMPAGYEKSFLNRALARVESPVDQELTALVNSALVADGAALRSREGMEAIFRRVHGYLSIALEHLSDGDVERAAAIIGREYLSRLFRLGFGMVMELRKRHESLAIDDYATGRVIEGLRATPPRFYRALDPDGIDGFREFRELDDIRRIDELLGRHGDPA
ncbi:DUF6178 family protein [Geobacter sulfurreducens]|uniref:DUF6178 family protein n=1 Tax=Geobacter sulfurreducens TaxID=35554 RepID=UPI002BAE30FC|nr:DUF6178 family protein [Geobacter sulfurreducens]HML78589.1 DUF6178 family protein [Geobacter sulfurreducens]